MMKNRGVSISLLIVAVMIGLTAVAANADNLNEQQVRLLQDKWEFFGGPALENIIVILFLSIGPLAIIPAFAKLTANADSKLKNRMAFRGFWISTITILTVALIGQGMIANYRVSLNALLTATGLILAIVAVRSILAAYGSKQNADPEAEKPALAMALSPLSFPIILPPFGIAIVLLIMIVGTRLDANVNLILGIIVILMVLNFICMLSARAILKVLRPQFLQVVGVVLSVIKLGIGITWIYGGIALEVGSIMRIIGS